VTTPAGARRRRHESVKVGDIAIHLLDAIQAGDRQFDEPSTPLDACTHVRGKRGQPVLRSTGSKQAIDPTVRERQGQSPPQVSETAGSPYVGWRVGGFELSRSERLLAMSRRTTANVPEGSLRGVVTSSMPLASRCWCAA
jgi:hypothetical protein